MCRHEIKELQKVISEYKPNMSEMTNGNTPSPLSPTSVGSQVRIFIVLLIHSFKKPIIVFLIFFHFVKIFNTFQNIKIIKKKYSLNRAITNGIF